MALRLHQIPAGTARRALEEATKKRSKETGGSSIAIVVSAGKNEVLAARGKHPGIPEEALKVLASRKRVMLDGDPGDRPFVERIMRDATFANAGIGLNSVCHHNGKYGGESGEDDENVFG